MSQASVEFPQYMMIVNRRKIFMTMEKAGQVFNGNWANVDVGGLVLEYDGTDITARDITKEERQQISKIADCISASK